METEWHDTHVFKERCWKDKQRDQAVNRAWKDSLWEAKQESRREDVSTKGDARKPEAGCPDRVQMSLDPFGETPGLTTEPSNEEPGEHQEITGRKEVCQEIMIDKLKLF